MLIEVSQDPIDGIRTTGAAAWQPQFPTPSLAEYRNAIAGFAVADLTNPAAYNKPFPGPEGLRCDIAKHLIVACIKTNRTANDRTGRLRLQRTHATY